MQDAVESTGSARGAGEPQPLTVSVNGAPRALGPGATVADLVVALGLRAELVAVEVNRALVPRRRHAEHALAEGDRVEIVTLVGGG